MLFFGGKKTLVVEDKKIFLLTLSINNATKKIIKKTYFLPSSTLHVSIQFQAIRKVQNAQKAQLFLYIIFIIIILLIIRVMKSKF
jgi:t-SNARE complex subunit (syntaxin)